MIKLRSTIPSLFTVMNLFCGFVAIKSAFVDMHLETAGWFIVLGGIFDVMDGLMARLTHSASEFGVELDSLADVVTFGVGPSAIVYQAFFYRYQGLGLLLAALPAIAGSLRLARFNVQLVGFDKDYFKGLPIPSSALLIVSYITFYYLHPDPRVSREVYDAIMFVVVLGGSAMMVSKVKYDAIPKLTKQALLAAPVRYAIYLIAIALAFITKGSAIFPFFVLFILYGIVRSLVERINRARREHRAGAMFEDEEPEGDDEEDYAL